MNGAYVVPYFVQDNQTLKISGDLKQENTDSYDSENISALVSVERQLTKELKLGLGVGARISRVEEVGEDPENFELLLATGLAEWDSRNNILDPTRGIFAQATITPFTDVSGQGDSENMVLEANTRLARFFWAHNGCVDRRCTR